jgi:hypothetical protein
VVQKEQAARRFCRLARSRVRLELGACLYAHGCCKSISNCWKGN